MIDRRMAVAADKTAFALFKRAADCCKYSSGRSIGPEKCLVGTVQRGRQLHFSFYNTIRAMQIVEIRDFGYINPEWIRKPESFPLSARHVHRQFI